jgi:hypothetical protein
MNRRALFSLSLAAIALGGCSKFKKLTGQTDDTVLPGERREILTPDQYTAKNEDLNKKPAGESLQPSASTGTKSGNPCNPEVDLECAPEQINGNDGVFSDDQ